MTYMPEVGERVYAWRPMVSAGRSERHRTEGTVVDRARPFSWVSYAIGVRMDDTGHVERFGHFELDRIPAREETS